MALHACHTYMLCRYTKACMQHLPLVMKDKDHLDLMDALQRMDTHRVAAHATSPASPKPITLPLLLSCGVTMDQVHTHCYPVYLHARGMGLAVHDPTTGLARVVDLEHEPSPPLPVSHSLLLRNLQGL